MSRMGRRKFLRNSAGAAAVGAATLTGCATPAAAPAPKPGRVMGANDRIRMGVIGIRSQGDGHIKELLGLQKGMNVEVAALCDVDEHVLANRMKEVEDATGKAPAIYTDLRDLFDDDSIDAVSTATPDHWHALVTIWACQAEKDVYVEKPVSHNVGEGRKIVEAARKYNRIVQTGTQNRSRGGVRKAMELLHEGAIGEVFMARALCFKPRDSIGVKPDTETPPWVHYDIWLGPAPKRPFNENRFHYNWHWFWDYGTTDMGNQGIHQMDIARWGLNRGLPTKVQGVGGRFGYKDQAETPNTQVTTFEYNDGAQLVFEVRGRFTNDEGGVRIGNLFYGSKGYMTVNGNDYQIFLGRNEKPEPSQGVSRSESHMANFLKAVRSRNREDLNADILEGHLSSALCHLGNVAYRLGRKLTFDPKTETFVGDEEANMYLTRNYRPPFVVPEKV